MREKEIVERLEKWMGWCRSEQMITVMEPTYLSAMTTEQRQVRADALYSAEARLGLLMGELDIDLRPKKIGLPDLPKKIELDPAPPPTNTLDDLLQHLVEKYNELLDYLKARDK